MNLYVTQQEPRLAALQVSWQHQNVDSTLLQRTAMRTRMPFQPQDPARLAGTAAISHAAQACKWYVPYANTHLQLSNLWANMFWYVVYTVAAQ